MGALFSTRKKVSRITDHDKAILQLKCQRDNLKKYQLKIEEIMERDRNLAKRLLKEGKTDRAKLLLKKKRYQEQLLQKTDGQLENVEKLTQDLEFAQVEVKVVEGLKVGNTALKKINDMMNIDDIEQILEETKEGIAKQQEIDEMLNGVLTNEDEEMVEKELTELISSQTVAPELTSIPDEEPVAVPEPQEKKKSKEKIEPVMVAA